LEFFCINKEIAQFKFKSESDFMPARASPSIITCYLLLSLTCVRQLQKERKICMVIDHRQMYRLTSFSFVRVCKNDL